MRRPPGRLVVDGSLLKAAAWWFQAAFHGRWLSSSSSARPKNGRKEILANMALGGGALATFFSSEPMGRVLGNGINV